MTDDFIWLGLIKTNLGFYNQQLDQIQIGLTMPKGSRSIKGLQMQLVITFIMPKRDKMFDFYANHKYQIYESTSNDSSS